MNFETNAPGYFVKDVEDPQKCDIQELITEVKEECFAHMRSINIVIFTIFLIVWLDVAAILLLVYYINA